MDRLGSQQVCPPLALIRTMDNSSDAVEIRHAATYFLSFAIWAVLLCLYIYILKDCTKIFDYAWIQLVTLTIALHKAGLLFLHIFEYTYFKVFGHSSERFLEIHKVFYPRNFVYFKCGAIKNFVYSSTVKCGEYEMPRLAGSTRLAAYGRSAPWSMYSKQIFHHQTWNRFTAPDLYRWHNWSKPSIGEILWC